MTLNACITQRPAVIALVVAIAGIIFPAISAEIVSLEQISQVQIPTLDVEFRSRRYAKYDGTHVGTSGDKVECIVVVLVKGEHNC